ncbi:MAG: DsrE family protein [Rhodocyclales bacterium]|nr:DsrE family protein [Rhodocyclales bacterium]
MIRRTALVGLCAAAFIVSAPLPAASAEPAKARVIFQVSDADPAKWNLAFNNIKNVQADLGKDGTEVEIVAYGPGIGMLKADSLVANRVADAMAAGVKVMACENTMTNQKIKREDMMEKIGYVKAGVVELMQKQREGWAYIRP